MVIGFVVFDAAIWGGVLAHASSPSVPLNIAPPPTIVPPPHADRVGIPVRLKIAAISVNAPIEKVSVTKAGAMGIPKDPMDAAWFSPGPRPGEMGNAVIDGHLNWYQGATGVFAKLRSVKPGDRIMVVDESRKEVAFVVRDIRTYAAGADATDVFRSTDDGSHLILITCDGAWDAHAKQYSKRLVVFADKLE